VLVMVSPDVDFAQRLDAFERIPGDLGSDAKGSAVVVALFEADAAALPEMDDPRAEGDPAIAPIRYHEPVGGLSVLLTRRSSKLRSHPGQWALPGGRLEPGEDARTGALRELAEELGLHVPATAVLGELDDFVTRSGYFITPVVVWLAGGISALVAQPEEVAEVHVAQLAHLDVQPRFVTVEDSPRPVIQMPIFDSLIHAPTGAILYQAAELLIHGRTTRVAHYEQPFFARK
jgi:8-oxo-dGTP pyrophosphatase MutT (NUDIX family)